MNRRVNVRKDLPEGIRDALINFFEESCCVRIEDSLCEVQHGQREAANDEELALLGRVK